MKIKISIIAERIKSYRKAIEYHMARGDWATCLKLEGRIAELSSLHIHYTPCSDYTRKQYKDIFYTDAEKEYSKNYRPGDPSCLLPERKRMNCIGGYGGSASNER